MNLIERKHTNERMSKWVSHGNTLYLSGQTAVGSKTAAADISAQTHEALSRVDALLTEAGSERGKILSATIFLKNIGDFAAMNAVWESWVAPGTAPARTTIEARLGADSLLFEVSVIAAL